MLKAVAQTLASGLYGLLTTPQGRLTLATATPVMTATVSAATTAFYTPSGAGDRVPIFDGTNWQTMPCAELSNVSTASSVGSAGPAAVGASKINDLFVWNNAGTLTLTRGPDWTNNTTRALTLTRQNGILLNTSAITNGPAALRGTFVGTIASNAGSTWDYIFGASASGGTAGSFQVWNAYNRVNTTTKVTDSGVAYTYTLATIRQARASAGNQVSFVLGLQEDGAFASYSTAEGTVAAVGGTVHLGLGLDSTSTFSLPERIAEDLIAGAGLVSGGSSSGLFVVPIGVHTISGNEASDASNANTFDVSSTNALTVMIRN